MTTQFKPEFGEYYYHVGHDGARSTARWSNSTVDQYRYNTGNCFKYSEETDKYISRLHAIASGRAAVVDIPEGYEMGKVIPPTGAQSVPLMRVYLMSRTPPPPKEVTVKVYDVHIHGEPDRERPYIYAYTLSKRYYYYNDEMNWRDCDGTI